MLPVQVASATYSPIRLVTDHWRSPAGGRTLVCDQSLKQASLGVASVWEYRLSALSLVDIFLVELSFRVYRCNEGFA